MGDTNTGDIVVVADKRSKHYLRVGLVVDTHADFGGCGGHEVEFNTPDGLDREYFPSKSLRRISE